MPTDYDHEKWFQLYKKAIFELEHAKVMDRIEDARAEITERIEKLRRVPEGFGRDAGLGRVHAAELHAIDDAHRMLRLLEGEEQRYAAQRYAHSEDPSPAPQHSHFRRSG